MLFRVSGFQVVVQSRENYVVADKGTISDSDSALVLEFASHIDEYIFADGDIFSAVCVEWRKHAEAAVYRLSDDA